jgi:UDP:flavonoid glycosyltransferase YjiC (YdhE family)
VKVPLLTLHVQPAVIWSNRSPPKLPGVIGPAWLQRVLFRFAERLIIDRTVCPAVNPMRRELGLPPMRRITSWWHSPQGVIGLFPDWYAPPQPDWPAQVQLTDFPLWDEPGDDAVDAELESFLQAGTAPLVFTPGSANMFGQQFFQTAVHICSRLRRRGLLVSRFEQHLPATRSPDIRHVEYAPFSTLLPRVAAIVHHGGMGTTAQALAAGIPQMIVPLAHDEFDNAARLAELGVGDWIYRGKFRDIPASRRLRELLSSPQVALCCQQAAERLAGRDGISRTADAVEHFAARWSSV